jgi:hypothetical protein
MYGVKSITINSLLSRGWILWPMGVSHGNGLGNFVIAIAAYCIYKYIIVYIYIYDTK